MDQAFGFLGEQLNNFEEAIR